VTSSSCSRERERDFDDVVTLVRDRGSSLDLEYVERWVRTLDESVGGDDVSARRRAAVEAAKVKTRRRR
jgi:hypothetical protein